MAFEFLDEKIKVFISSDCKEKIYIDIRSKLKKHLEKTRFIKTYVFE